jgi:hypothetical protein
MVTTVLTLDQRSLGLFRVLLGFNLIYDILWKWCTIGDFVGVKGVFDIHFLTDKIFVNNDLHTIISYFPNQFSVYAFLVFSLLVFLAYTLGIKARYAGIIAFFCYLNICDANLFLVVGYQNILIVLLGWSIFLPIDARFSLLPHSKQLPMMPIAVLGILLQISLIYFIAAFAKSGMAWHDATAVDMVLSSKFYQKSTALWLLQYPFATSALSYATIIFEYSIPILLFLPFFNNNARILAAIQILLFHWGLFLFVDVGNFHLVSLCTAAILLPASVWKNKYLPAPAQAPIISRLELRLRQYIIAITLFGVIICSIFQLKTFRPQLVPDFDKNIVLNGIKDAYLVHSKMTLFFRQRWSYFAPNPSQEMGWLKLAGQKNDYNWINLNNGLALDKDSNVSNFSGAWKHIAAFCVHRGDIPHSRLLMPRWVAYQTQQWNKANPEQIVSYAGAYVYSIKYDSLKMGKNEPLVVQIWEGFTNGDIEKTE